MTGPETAQKGRRRLRNTLVPQPVERPPRRPLALQHPHRRYLRLFAHCRQLLPQLHRECTQPAADLLEDRHDVRTKGFVVTLALTPLVQLLERRERDDAGVTRLRQPMRKLRRPHDDDASTMTVEVTHEFLYRRRRGPGLPHQ